MGELRPGDPVRIINDIRDIPTIIHPYGEIPIINASAGVRRIVTLAYLIVWAWHEHKINSELMYSKPENRMVILIDEIEAHLHPKWQRTILPALLGIQSLLSSELEIQFFISTHSPLVMASVESFFDAEIDKLFHLSTNKDTGEAELIDMDFVKYGHINSWLTSPIFSLGQARAQDAEIAINRAINLQKQKNVDKVEIAKTHMLLLNELSETDPFWPRWIYFAEQNGVSI
jgi:predicted ATP-binding protein involved in virulence